MMNVVSFKTLLSLLAIAGKLTYGEGRMGEGLNVRIEAPSVVRVGDKVVLKCLYDLSGESLYTMKWYRGPAEFYRFTPKEIPQVKTFPPLGFFIDLSQSNATHLTLQRANLSLAGRYDCEVTTDFPNVIADVKHVYLRVIAYPEKKPEIVISPNKRRYALGDLLEANCSSYRSKPAANLTWLINGKRVSSKYRQQPPQEYRYRDGPNTESSRITISIEITPQHFVSGQLRLSCVAEIIDHYYQTSDVVITEEDRPKISSVVDNSSSTGSGSNTRFKNSGTFPIDPVFLFLLLVTIFPLYSSTLLTLTNANNGVDRGEWGP